MDPPEGLSRNEVRDLIGGSGGERGANEATHQRPARRATPSGPHVSRKTVAQLTSEARPVGAGAAPGQVQFLTSGRSSPVSRV